jgi:PhoPQ-activated pathogenicity-related protein
MVRLLHRFPAVLALLALAPAAFAADAVPAVDQSVDGQPEEALARYVAKPEPAYGWKLVEKNNLEGMTLYKLEMTSQTWQDIDWQHALYVYEPSELKFHDHAILFVAGGSRLGPPRAEEQLIAVGLANLSGGRVAILKQVPNQPLFDDRYEDDLITETWLKYLQTGDANWPLLFPMVKSAVKAMDTLRELGEKEGWAEPVEKFVITGASKLRRL